MLPRDGSRSSPSGSTSCLATTSRIGPGQREAVLGDARYSTTESPGVDFARQFEAGLAEVEFRDSLGFKRYATFKLGRPARRREESPGLVALKANT